MDITQALAETLRSEKAIRKVTLPAMAKAAGISRASVMRKLEGTRETKIAELRGFAVALDTTAHALMESAEDRLERAIKLEPDMDGWKEGRKEGRNTPHPTLAAQPAKTR